MTKALSELDTEFMPEGTSVATAEATSGGMETSIIEDAPVTKIVATILHYAVEGNASDIHIEHMATEVRVRFPLGRRPQHLAHPARQDTRGARCARQDSQICVLTRNASLRTGVSARIEGRRIDFRVSTFPSYYGEKVVMRILDTEKGVKPLGEMGLSERNLTLIREALDKPYGMILISGPTGSGKSTTLYTMLNEIDREKYNVLSLEDPVEYNIPGMSQSQIRPEIGYTFATGLRHTSAARPRHHHGR